ncbi:hypothetical protein J6590_019728 [Homalodisca vitripennis]|nr:hypothetical protein J6590_019728 [Homalodisca vitripennis]
MCIKVEEVAQRAMPHRSKRGRPWATVRRSPEVHITQLSNLVPVVRSEKYWYVLSGRVSNHGRGRGSGLYQGLDSTHVQRARLVVVLLSLLCVVVRVEPLGR